MGKPRMVAKFYPYGALMINRCSRILIVCHLYCFRKHIKLSDDTHGECCESCSFCHVNILVKKVTRFFFFVFYDWITIIGYSKHERSTINMLYSLNKICHITVHAAPTSPWRSPLYNGHFLLSPRCRLWRGSTVLYLLLLNYSITLNLTIFH